MIKQLQDRKIEEKFFFSFVESWNDFLVPSIDLGHEDACHCIKSLLCHTKEQTEFDIALAERVLM